MIKFKLLLKLILLLKLVAGEKIKCTQCIGGNFNMKRWLFQSPTMPIEYGWMTIWNTTDCHAGKYNVRECDYSCLTIVLEQDKKDDRGYQYDGIMMDCSEYIIHKTPDLPEDIDFRYYNGDAMYWAIRANHNLTYIFNSSSVEGVAGIHDLPIKTIPESFDTKYIANTFELRSLIFFCIFAIVVLFSLYVILKCAIIFWYFWCIGKRMPLPKVRFHNSKNGRVAFSPDNENEEIESTTLSLTSVKTVISAPPLETAAENLDALLDNSADDDDDAAEKVVEKNVEKNPDAICIGSSV